MSVERALRAQGQDVMENMVKVLEYKQLTELVAGRDTTEC